MGTTSQARAIADKPASQATFLEQTAAGVLRSAVIGDGEIPPEAHANYAVRVSMALCEKLASLGGAA